MKSIIEIVFTIRNLNIIMPAILVFCAFGLKIFREYPLDMVDFISTVIELPMDIIILSLGYMSSYICASPNHIGVGFGMFSIEIAIAIFISGFTKSAISIYQSTKRNKANKIELTIYCSLSYVLAIGAYIVSILIYGGE